MDYEPPEEGQPGAEFNEDDMADLDDAAMQGGLVYGEDEELNMEDMNMEESNSEEDEVNMQHINDLDNRLDKLEDHLNMPHDLDENNKDNMMSPDEEGQSGGGGCSSGHSKEEEKLTGGASWGGLQAYDDSSGFAAF